MPPWFRVLSQFHSASLLLYSAEMDRFLPHPSLSSSSPFKCSLTLLLFPLIAMTLLSLLLFFPYFCLILSSLPPHLPFPFSLSLHMTYFPAAASADIWASAHVPWKAWPSCWGGKGRGGRTLERCSGEGWMRGKGRNRWGEVILRRNDSKTREEFKTTSEQRWTEARGFPQSRARKLCIRGEV